MNNFSKKFPGMFLLGACCALAGVAPGFHAGRNSAVASAASTAGENPADMPNNPDKNQHRADGARDAQPKKLSDAAPLETPAQWRESLGQWMAAGCPAETAYEARQRLGRWVRVDAMGALEFVHGAARFSNRNEAYALALATLGETAMPRAIEWMRRNLPRRARIRQDVAALVIQNMAEKFPHQAAQLALADDVTGPNSYLCSVVLTSLMRKSPAHALALFDRVSPEAKRRAFPDMVSAWAATNPSAALDWCASQRETPHAEQSTNDLLNVFSQHHIPELPALIDLLGVDAGALSPFAMTHVIKQNPAVGLELLKKRPAGIVTYHMQQMLVEQLFKTSPVKALETAVQLLPADRQAHWLLLQWEHWRQTDRNAADEWLAALPDQTLLGQIQTLQSLNSDPSAYLASVGAGTTGGAADADDAFSRECVSRALGYLTYTKGAAEAVRWLLEHPGHITERRFSLAAGDLVSAVTLEAAAAIPDESAREIVLGHMAHVWVANGKGELATDAISRIQNPERREQVRFGAFSRTMNLAENDGAKQAARQWLAAQPLPETVRMSWELLVEGGAGLPVREELRQERKSAPLEKNKSDSASQAPIQ